MAVWKSSTVQQALATNLGGPFLWNGDKICWASKQIQDIKIMVDLDALRGRTPNPAYPNTYRFHLKPAKIIRLAVLNAFLKRQTPFDTACLESISKFFSMLQYISRAFN
jgi:hypothetical protein